MPFKYIGRTTDFKGKSLWEIVGNLRNLGIGRIITRSRFERYPEPTYMKILKVETLPEPEVQSMDNIRKVRVLVEKTFRGKTLPKPILIESASYKADYRLIPKDEETSFCRYVDNQTPNKIFPRTMEFPPLLKELILREHENRGSKSEIEPQLDIVYNKRSAEIKYRIAEEGEKPNVHFTMGLGEPASPCLYEGVNLNS